VTLAPVLAEVALEAFITSFLFAIRIAMPLIASGMLAEVALGLLVRTAPQMNIFVVGISLKVMLGLIIMLALVPAFAAMTRPLFNEMFEYIGWIFG
jgi:flagellar biosynthetic protein FliR